MARSIFTRVSPNSDTVHTHNWFEETENQTYPYYVQVETVGGMYIHAQSIVIAHEFVTLNYPDKEQKWSTFS